MADPTVDTSELITKAMLVAAEAVFVQGFAGLNTALLANAAATAALTAANKASGTTPSASAQLASSLGASSPATTVMAAKTNAILQDILFAVVAFRTDVRNAEPASVAAAKSPKDDPKETKAGPSAFAMIGNAIVGKLASVLGPVAVLGQVVNSAAGGFQILTAAMGVLAAVLAPIVLPLFIALAGAVLDLSEDLQAKLSPGLKQFAAIVFDGLIPVLAKLIDWYLALNDALADAMLAVKNFAVSLFTTTAKADPKRVAEVNELRKAGRSEGYIRAELRKRGASEAEIAAATATPDEKKARGSAYYAGGTDGPGTRDEGDRGGGRAGRRGATDALTSLLLSLGPKASFSGLADVGKNAQLAGLNGDPIQQRLLEATLRGVAIAEEGLGIARRGAEGRGAGPAPLPRDGEID